MEGLKFYSEEPIWEEDFEYNPSSWWTFTITTIGDEVFLSVNNDTWKIIKRKSKYAVIEPNGEILRGRFYFEGAYNKVMELSGFSAYLQSIERKII